MKKLTKIFFIVSAVILVAAIAAGIYWIAFQDSGMKEGNVTLHAPGSAMVLEETELIGLPLTAAASCKVAGYSASFAVDGDIETYWEGAGEYPQYLTLNLSEKAAVTEMTLSLNPLEVWGKRTQNFAVETSLDGENFTELLADTEYVFDWAEGNTVIVPLPGNPEVVAVRLVFSYNSGAGGGQIAEAVLMPAASDE
jgi:hypothetical protein